MELDQFDVQHTLHVKEKMITKAVENPFFKIAFH